MLGSINTGGFNKSQVAAMQDSNYFNRKGVPGIYSPPDRKAPRITGSDFKDNYIKTKIFPGFGEDEEGNTVQDRFMQGFKSYRPKEKTSEEKIYDNLLQMGTGGQMGGGYNTTISDAFGAPNFTVMQNATGSPTVIQGRQGEEGYGSSIGGAIGTAVGGPIGGAIGGALGGIFCDVRVKEDIAPLCNSDVNDLLSECAFFVKDLNECS